MLPCVSSLTALRNMPDIPTSNPKQFIQGAPLLTVPDVAGTSDFYRSVLGFETDPGSETSDYCVVWRDNAAVHITKGEQPPVGVRLFFWVQDVNGLYDEIVNRGAEI